MKINYIVIFDDAVETYCTTLKAAKKTVDEMVEDYSCETLPERTLRKDVEIYKVSKVRI